MNRFLISAAHKSSGKTTVSVGLSAALGARGLVIAPFKKGPDYIDPLWLGQAAGRPCWNLDFFTMAPEEISACFMQHAAGADVALVEGNKGLHDGLDVEGSDSNAALARLLNLPVLLVLDVTGITRGVAPLLTGYARFDPGVRIAGVILNRVAGPRQEGKLRSAIERYTDLPVLGAIGRQEALGIEERHLGLVPGNEDPDSKSRIETIARVIEGAVDFDALLEATVSPDPGSGLVVGTASAAVVRPDVRIGIARDRVFGFYYPDDLAAFATAGAELVAFDTLADASLPPVDGLFIGGGFPECFLGALADNVSLRNDIRKFIAHGGPAYAECGGLMYLTRSLTWQGASADMVGVIPADTQVGSRPVGRGYMQFKALPGHPWSRLLQQPETLYHAHEFHYSRLENVDSAVQTVLEVRRGYGIDGRRDGIHVANLLATYAHQRHVRSNPWVNDFVDFVRSCR